MWNMIETVIATVASELGIVLKGLEKKTGEVEIRRKIEIIQTTTTLRLA